jgi:hypothetical protein
MDVLRRYLEIEKSKNGESCKSKLPKALRNENNSALDIDVEIFLENYNKKHSPKYTKDPSPKF